MEKILTFFESIKQINLSIGPSSIEECFQWDEKQRNECVELYISVFKQLRKQYPEYHFYLVSFLLLGFPENKLQQKLQERFEIEKFYCDNGICFSELIYRKILESNEDVPRVVSVASINEESFNAFLLESEHTIKNYLIMTCDELKEDLLEKAIHCKCDEFLLEIDNEFIKELGEDVVISFADIGVDGNSITIHYDRFCPAIHSFSLDGIKVDE